MDASSTAAVVSGAGVVITALLTTFTAIRSGRDRRERETDRRRLEEQTTDAILDRVNKELTRAYKLIDKKDRQIRTFTLWIQANREKFERLDIDVPSFIFDEDTLENGLSL